MEQSDFNKLLKNALADLVKEKKPKKKELNDLQWGIIYAMVFAIFIFVLMLIF